MCAICEGGGLAYHGARDDDSTGPLGFTNADDRGGVVVGGRPSFTVAQAAAQITRPGLSWSSELGAPAVVTFGFRASPGINPGESTGFARFNEAQIDTAMTALAAWSDVAGVTFVRVGSGTTGEAAYTDSATILMGAWTGGLSTLGQASLPGSRAAGAAAGDVWINGTVPQLTAPVMQAGLRTFVHEIGHAIGLAHPGVYNAGGGAAPTYGANAEYVEDTDQYSIMSYFDAPATGGSVQSYARGGGAYAAWNPGVPMMDDIAAAQRLYGVNTTTRTGDTVYGFNATADREWFRIAGPEQATVFCVWDAGGNDTFDFSQYRENQRIDLRPGAFSDIGGDGLPSTTGVSALGNVSIAVGVVIENAIGGSGSDLITGNAAGNILIGNAGDDRLRGAGGDDTLLGGDGNDVLEGGDGADMLDGGRGHDTLDGGGGNDRILGGDGDDLIHGHGGEGRYDGGAGTDTLTFERSVRGVDFDLTAGGAGLESVIGSNFQDALGGDERANVLNGGGGGDFIVGRGGDDTINGGDGDDRLSGGTGRDVIDGGAGVDILLLDRDASLYTVGRIGGGYALAFNGGVTTVRDVERISFDNGATSIAIADFESQAFDPFAYLVANRDLLSTLGYDAAALRNHYFTTGATQGRPAGTFDALSYVAANFDLARAYGTDVRRATEHYIGAGQNEGRATTFDALRYVASNVDLIGAFGDDVDAATRHYIGAGVFEGRSTTAFDPLLYSASNADLAREFGPDTGAASLHYVNLGFAAGRPTTGFDALQYLASNFDLAQVFGVDPAAGLNHYLGAGAIEGRATNAFSGKLYAATWVDLARYFGTDENAARQHYLQNGADEGRVATGFDPVAYLLSNADIAGRTATQALDHWLTTGADQGRAGDSLFGREQPDHVWSSVTRGMFNTTNDRDWFERTFAAGERITLSTSGVGGVTYSLHDSLGRVLTPVAGQADTFALMAGGTYYIAVSSTDGLASSYEIQFTRALTAPGDLAVAAPADPDLAAHVAAASVALGLIRAAESSSWAEPPLDQLSDHTDPWADPVATMGGAAGD